MNQRWIYLAALAALAVVVLLVWRFAGGGEPPRDDLSNATIDRLEREVDSLQVVIGARDEAIAAYEGRVAGLDQRLVEISGRNTSLLTNLSRQRRTIEHVSNDSLARDLNRILRGDLRLTDAGPAEAGLRR